jgi:hypothetical protein
LAKRQRLTNMYAAVRPTTSISEKPKRGRLLVIKSVKRQKKSYGRKNAKQSG